MGKQYSFKSTKNTEWLEQYLDGISSSDRSRFIRNCVIHCIKNEVDEVHLYSSVGQSAPLIDNGLQRSTMSDSEVKQSPTKNNKVTQSSPKVINVTQSPTPEEIAEEQVEEVFIPQIIEEKTESIQDDFDPVSMAMEMFK